MCNYGCGHTCLSFIVFVSGQEFLGKDYWPENYAIFWSDIGGHVIPKEKKDWVQKSSHTVL